MSTTVTEARDEIIERLKISAGTGTQPSNAMIEGFVRGGFKALWAQLLPVFRAQATVSSTQDVTTIDSALTGILYVSGPRDMMLPYVDWVETSTGLALRSLQFAVESDNLVVWFTTAPTDFGSSLTIESTCVFGPDWLEEAVLLYAESQALKRMSRTHDSGGHNTEAATWVTVAQDLERMMGQMRETRERWIGRMDAILEYRRATRGIARESGLRDWENSSGIENRATRVQTGTQTRRDNS